MGGSCQFSPGWCRSFSSINHIKNSQGHKIWFTTRQILDIVNVTAHLHHTAGIESSSIHVADACHPPPVAGNYTASMMARTAR